MGQKTGRFAVLEQFVADGFRYMFGNPGTVEQGFLDALDDYPQLQSVLALQESVAVLIGDGYARAARWVQRSWARCGGAVRRSLFRARGRMWRRPDRSPHRRKRGTARGSHGQSIEAIILPASVVAVFNALLLAEFVSMNADNPVEGFSSSMKVPVSAVVPCCVDTSPL